MPTFQRYTAGARVYDLLSGEWPVYRAGRVAGIAMLAPAPGDVVLDLGCGTGLNFALLHEAVGAGGLVIGVDRSPHMLAVARARVRRHEWSNVRLLEADAATLDPAEIRGLAASAGRDGVDAMIATYALSVIDDWRAAWVTARAIMRSRARAAIVDMQPPTGAAVVFAPVARAACALGGADILARPWTVLVDEGRNVSERRLRGGHIVAVAATLP